MPASINRSFRERASRVGRVANQHIDDVLLAQHVGEPVGAQQDEIATTQPRLDDVGVERDAAGRPTELLREHVAAGVRCEPALRSVVDALARDAAPQCSVTLPRDVGGGGHRVTYRSYVLGLPRDKSVDAEEAAAPANLP